jgi:MraZ protein
MPQLDNFERKLDSKNRLTIPAEVREEFTSGELVITRGFGNYLHLYSKEVWDADMESALSGDILDERVADLNVRFRTGKQIAALDQKQGRITIEQRLLDYAGIDTDVVAVRVGKYWRLMSPDRLPAPAMAE